MVVWAGSDYEVEDFEVRLGFLGLVEGGRSYTQVIACIYWYSWKTFVNQFIFIIRKNKPQDIPFKRLHVHQNTASHERKLP